MAAGNFPEQISILRQALDGGGLADGLAYLNSRVEHRFTAVYRLSSDFVMENVAIVDKLGEVVPDALMAVPLGDSFCQFVLKDGFFKLTDAETQAGRLDGHAYKGIVQSYVGLPLTKNSGDLFGTLCHFDFPARPIGTSEFEYLVEAARLLPAYLR